MSTVSLSIAFLLGAPDISGGTYVIFEHGTRLQKLGHRVSVVTETPVESARYSWHPEAAKLNWLSLSHASEQKFDMVLATWWQSPFLLPQLTASHYIYFVQSIESRFFEETDPADHDLRDLHVWKEYCESTYSLNLPVITEAQWIKDYLYENYNRDAFLVRNGIRKDIYKEDGPARASRVEGKLRVLIEGPVDVFYKNVPKSIKLCAQAGVDEIWLLTSSDIDTFPGVDRVFSRIPIHETPEIYRSCDVLVKLSYIEGMFGPPLEMFHCGGTAIVYDVTGHDEYIIHNQNSYVVKKDDDERVVEYIRKLKDDPQELQRLKKAAGVTADSWTDWDSAASRFEKVLLQINTLPPDSRNYINAHTKQLQEENDNRLNSHEFALFQARECDEKSDNANSHNFVQLYYWAEKDGLSGDNFCWANYQCGKQSEISLEIPITGFPFWIRLDPSVRIGIICIDSISVKNIVTEELIMSFQSSEQFNTLYAGGTLRPLNVSGRTVFLSYGNDPQLVLPAMDSGRVGDKLQITICFKEMGVGPFINESDLLCSSNEQSGIRRLLKKMFFV